MHARQRDWIAILVCIGIMLMGGGPHAAAQEADLVQADSVQAERGGLMALSDSLLQAHLQGIFAQIEPFQTIDVQVQSGVVRLGGTVLQPQAADRAEELASRLEGVIYVINDIEAETDVETRVAPALEKIQTYLQRVISYLPLAGVALLIVVIFGVLSRLLGRWEDPPQRLKVRPLVWQLIRRVVQGIVAFVGLLLAFDILGVTSMVGAVLGTAGVAGLAIGFAFQDIIENYLAGVLLSIQQPFNVNDVVQIDDHQGRVIRLTARELVLLTVEGNHIRLPNATVFKNVMTNYTRNPRRLFSFDIGIGVEEDLVEVARIGVDTLNAMNGVMEDPQPFVRIEALGDSSVIVRFNGWVNQQTADFFKVKSEAIRLVKTALDEAEIDMPEPIHRLRVWQQEAAPEKPQPPAEPAREQAAAIDVEPDHKLEAQVEEDLAQSDEPNLLTDE